MQLSFEGTVWYWRGPAPYYFVTVPEVEAGMIATTASSVTYGWGMIPVSVQLGETEFTTSLWPKNGGYIVPLKDKVRRAEEVEVDDTVSLELTIDV